jgi:hypothetical protein
MAGRMRLICLIVTAMLIGGGVASPAAAQERAAGDASAVKKLVISDEAIAAAFAKEARASVFQDKPDSLKNGIIIGAVIGGAAMGVFVTALCNALHEPGDPPCWQSTLTAGALGAGIGAAAGAGIDALAARQTPLLIGPERAARRGFMRMRF